MTAITGTAPPQLQGVAPRTTTGRVRALALVMIAGPVLGVAVVVSLSLGNATRLATPVAGAGVRLTPIASGLLTDEPFARPEPDRTFRDRFELDPLAPGNGVVFAGVGPHGFDVGVREHAGWEGDFAVTHDLYPAGSVFHADAVALPAVSTGGGIGETVFAVQTGSTKITSDVNFVAVNSYTHKGAVKWQVGYSAAKYQDARRTALAQVDDPPASLVPDHPVGITMRTDGYRTLRVYLDDTEVLDAGNLRMRMEPPLQPYLEVQAKDIAYTSRFTNFWVTASDTLRVDGLPMGARVRLGPAGTPIATGTADAHGSVRLELPLPKAHGTTPVAVRLPGEQRWRQVSRSFTYSGGDRYDASLAGHG